MRRSNNGNDRRAKVRFRVSRELQYKLLDETGCIGSGEGHTVDLSSGGIAFEADRELPPGVSVELSVSWPALLNEHCALRLSVIGRVVRSHGMRVVCSVDRYEFRTQGRPTESKRGADVVSPTQEAEAAHGE